ncbi:MAG: hypothetical protein WCP20_07990 [Desulfuromonadales bacterium]
MKNMKSTVQFRLVGCLLLIALAGCAAMSPYITQNDDSRFPPILSQDEVIRAYVKLGRIQITREVYKADGLVTPDIRDWGFAAIRREAAKMGADAVIYPEVTGIHTMTVVLPTTEYRASGIAIKFK